jgi:hypothetical protein
MASNCRHCDRDPSDGKGMYYSDMGPRPVGPFCCQYRMWDWQATIDRQIKEAKISRTFTPDQEPAP